MTFNSAPWAIDGARTPAGLARLAAYASGGGRSGIIQPGDLKVSALAVPGKGLRVSAGSAAILNGYLNDPDEAYVVANPSTHTVLSTDMPNATGATSYYLVCIVVGDPEFNQAGHPFMPSTPLSPEAALDFEYVRVKVIPCSSSTTSFEDLNYDYPAYALARLEVPPSTTTITSAMITDLRTLSKPRFDSKILMGRQSGTSNIDIPNSPASSWYNWINYRPYITIPKWATRMQILTHLAGVGCSPTAVAEIRTVAGTGAGPVETIDSDLAIRQGFMTAFDQNVSAIAGTSIQLTVQGRQLFDTPGATVADERTQIAFDVRFYEERI